MTSISSRVRRSQTFLLALLASSAVFTAGCANMATTAGGSGSSGGATLGGMIHGGNQPVAGATVTLWFAGQGTSEPAVLAATTTSSTTSGTGSFSFVAGASNGGTSGNTYKCPVQTNSPYVYVLATGGNTQGSGSHTNAASVFLAPYGPCNTLSASSFVDMTEVTTVATMAALQQYFVYSATAPVIAQSFDTGGSGLAYQSMGNAFNLIPNMVNVATGNAIPTTGLALPNGTGPGIGSTITMTAFPETAKINTIANILAACINIPDYPAGGNTACDTLFANAAPPASASTTAQPGANYTAATNTLQAAYYMLSNPTNGSTTKLAALFGLAPAAGAPFQPTLPSTTPPTDWTVAISYASTSTCGASGHLIQSAQGLAIDSFGGVWIANNETGGNLTYLTANGSPDTCIKVGTGANTGITIDDSPSLGNIWLADSGGSNVYRYLPGASSATAFPTSAAPQSIAADGAGNIYYTVPTSATLYELAQAATTSPVTPVAIATGIGSGPSVLVDSAPSVWTTSGASSINRTVCTTPNVPTSGTCSSTSFSPAGPTYGIAATAIYTIPGGTRNSIFISADGASNDLTLYQGINTTYTQITGWPVTGLSTPAAVASDGAQNAWTVNNGSSSVFEIGIGKQQLSPAAGFQKSSTYLGSARSLAIDSSGNVWIGLDNANSITEIVGAAVPVVQPFSDALKAVPITFQTIP